jgi:hypothetical protein
MKISQQFNMELHFCNKPMIEQYIMNKLPIEITMTSLLTLHQMYMSAMQCLLPTYPTRNGAASKMLYWYSRDHGGYTT